MSEPENPLPGLAEHGLQRQFDEVGAMVRGARQVLRESGAVDLSDLETRVAELCTRCRDLPRTRVNDYTSRLVNLMDELGKLEAEVKKQYTELKALLSGLNTRERATRAYGKGPSRGSQ